MDKQEAFVSLAATGTGETWLLTLPRLRQPQDTATASNPRKPSACTPPGQISTGVMPSRRRLWRTRCRATSGAGGAAVPREGSLRRCSRPATLAESGASLHAGEGSRQQGKGKDHA